MIVWSSACGRAAAPPPLVADVSGTRVLAGLSSPVRVVRDRDGIPHIYAANRDDLFFAQGFVQAQDRLFQIDLWRRAALGRLSEILGSNFAERDATTRRIQYAGNAAAEWANYPAETHAIASAFVRGVNAWVALARARPPEEFVLAGYAPEFWSDDDLLNRTDAFAASADAIEEIFRARVVATLGGRRAAALFPAEPLEVPHDLDPDVVSPVVADAIRSAGAPPFFLGLAAAPSSPAASANEPRVRADDMPLDVRTRPAPSPRYLVHLHAPGWNVAGAALPWMPGITIGHNERVAWNAEDVIVDAQDVFVERMNPTNPHQVEDRGRFVDTDLVKQPLSMRGRDKPLTIDLDRTHHGAIIALDRERRLAFAVRWTGAEAGAAGDLVSLELDRASSSADFRAALARWKAPARRFTYADVAGDSGSEIAALVPVRRGWSGSMPAPAWTGANEWTGWRRPAAAAAESAIASLARRHPARADTLLRALRDQSTGVDWPKAARALVVNAVADALRDDGPSSSPVLFRHPLAISDATRRRFDIGPLRPSAASDRFVSVASNATDWDLSTAMNAPGQSGSASSGHYADLAHLWAEGKSIPLPFTDEAVAAAAQSTLVLTPPPASRQ